MEKENQELSYKFTPKQPLNSLRIFEPSISVGQTFVSAEFEESLPSKVLEQSRHLNVIQPEHTNVELSKIYLRERSIVNNISNESNDSSVKVRKMPPPSIENIVMQYQKKENEERLKGIFHYNFQDIFNQKTQFSSIQIKTVHHIKSQESFQQKPGPQFVQVQSLKQVCCESKENAIQKNGQTSIKYIQHASQPLKCTQLTPIIEDPAETQQALAQIWQKKKVNQQLQNISELIKDFAKNRREICAKGTNKSIDWKLAKVIIERQLKCCANY